MSKEADVWYEQIVAWVKDNAPRVEKEGLEAIRREASTISPKAMQLLNEELVKLKTAVQKEVNKLEDVEVVEKSDPEKSSSKKEEVKPVEKPKDA